MGCEVFESNVRHIQNVLFSCFLFLVVVLIRIMYVIWIVLFCEHKQQLLLLSSTRFNTVHNSKVKVIWKGIRSTSILEISGILCRRNQDKSYL
jgi:hypothetical protein